MTTRHTARKASLTVPVIALGLWAATGPAAAQSARTGEIPYYWDSRPATSAAVVGGLQRAELQCREGATAMTAGGAILCAITGRDEDEDEDEDSGADPAAARVPTFGETVESILTGPR